jgi:hypothetical protein
MGSQHKNQDTSYAMKIAMPMIPNSYDPYTFELLFSHIISKGHAF